MCFSLCLGYTGAVQCVGLCQMAALAPAKLLSGHLYYFSGSDAPFLSRLNARRQMAAKAYSAVFLPV